MKVTALMPDPLVSDVKHFTQGKNITESLLIALTDWVQIQKLKALSDEIESKPLSFREDFSADAVRELSRPE